MRAHICTHTCSMASSGSSPVGGTYGSRFTASRPVSATADLCLECRQHRSITLRPWTSRVSDPLLPTGDRARRHADGSADFCLTELGTCAERPCQRRAKEPSCSAQGQHVSHC